MLLNKIKDNSEVWIISKKAVLQAWMCKMNKPANLSNTPGSQNMPHFTYFLVDSIPVTDYDRKSYIDNKADSGS